MKEETLEEVAKRIYGSEPSKDVEYYAFIAGAKWQQENSNVNALDFEIDSLKREIKLLKYKQERMYSEEQVLQKIRTFTREL